MIPVKRSERLEKLSVEIHDFMGLSIVPGPAILHFLSSTFSVDTPAQLREILAPEREDEAGLFLELLLSPDEEIQKRIEPGLRSGMFGPDDEKILSDLLKEKIRRITVRIQCHSDPVTFDVPAVLIERYVKKLHITRNIPHHLLLWMDEYLDEEMKNTVSVKIRQTVNEPDEKTMDFLGVFIKQAPDFGEDYKKHLDLALSVLAGRDKNKEPVDALISCLHNQIKTLDRIRTAEDMMKKNTMETLMLQGFRVPPESAENVEEKITLLRRMLSRLYGWMDPGRPEPSEIDLGDHEGKESMEHVIRLLS